MTTQLVRQQYYQTVKFEKGFFLPVYNEDPVTLLSETVPPDVPMTTIIYNREDGNLYFAYFDDGTATMKWKAVGSGGGGGSSPVVEVTGTTTTTDDTLTPISSYATQNGVTYALELRVVARDTINGGSMSQTINALFENHNSTLAKINSNDDVMAQGQAWTVTTSASGNNIVIKVAGSLGLNIAWKSYMRLLTV